MREDPASPGGKRRKVDEKSDEKGGEKEKTKQNEEMRQDEGQGRKMWEVFLFTSWVASRKYAGEQQQDYSRKR